MQQLCAAGVAMPVGSLNQVLDFSIDEIGCVATAVWSLTG